MSQNLSEFQQELLNLHNQMRLRPHSLIPEVEYLLTCFAPGDDKTLYFQ